VGIIERNYGQTISFASWMMVGVPLSIIMLIVTWVYLVKFAFKIEIDELPGGKELIRQEIKALGPISAAEKKILIIFLFASMSWIMRGFVDIEALSMLRDPTIAIIASALLFLTPVDYKNGIFLLDWQTASKVPWDVIVLFGGGLSLANGFGVTGLAEWIGGQLAVMHGSALLFLIFIVILLTIFLTEVTSNTATSTMMVPIMGSTAIAMSVHPYGLIVGAGIAASYAFMLPVATPPNAVVFGSKYVTIPQMAKAGLALNLIASVLIAVFVFFVMPWLWEIDLFTLPDWALAFVK